MSDSQADEWACCGADVDFANREILTDQIILIAAREFDIVHEDESVLYQHK